MLYDKLKTYSTSGVYPMHMPGHKRNTEKLPPGLPYDIDITEIHGFDDLHDPTGILEETSQLAARLYGSNKAYLLVNGTTVGILAAIGALTARGDKILIAGEHHWSVTNAAALFGLTPVFLPPETDETTGVALSVEPAAVKTALDKEPDVRLIVVTSPSYEGVVSDISAIADVAHSRNIPLLTDSAHGAHLGFSPAFPESAVQAGADIAVMSLHKTLPALTQCSLLHICTDRVDAAEVKRLLSVLQTSSPSYVLMASISQCLELLSSEKDMLFGDYERNLKDFDATIKTLKNLRVLCHGADTLHRGFFAYDPGKLVILAQNTAISGALLAEILRNDHRIEIERVCAGYVIAMTSVCDSPEGFSRLAKALKTIDAL